MGYIFLIESGKVSIIDIDVENPNIDEMIVKLYKEFNI